MKDLLLIIGIFIGVMASAMSIPIIIGLIIRLMRTSSGRRLRSWWHGWPTGSLMLCKGIPFRNGNMMHFLPKEMWSKEEHDSLKYNIVLRQWDGVEWFRKEEKMLSLLELKAYFLMLKLTGQKLFLEVENRPQVKELDSW